MHLLPRAKAWRITFVDKFLRKYFEGLTDLPYQIKIFFDLIWLDIFPQTTRCLDEWETQWGLPNNGLTEQQRRDRLDAAWQALGGQSPRYIQDTLQNNGFDVYVHEWWVPGTEAAVDVKACATARDPVTILGVGAAYPLVNKVTTITREYIAQFGGTSGADDIQFGLDDAQFGRFDDLIFSQKQYEIPTDMDKWPYFLYFGDAVFPNFASVPVARKDEFETLLLKICPAQQWLGILVNYV